MELKLKELPFELFDKIYLYVIFRPRTYRQLKKAVDEWYNSRKEFFKISKIKTKKSSFVIIEKTKEI